MSASPPRGAIFDLDGTLVDSYDAHFDAWVVVARELGHELSVEEFARNFGRTNPPILRELHELAGLPPPDEVRIAALADHKEAIFRDSIERSFPLMRGGPELLERLLAAGWRLAVGSSAPPANVELAIDRLGARGQFEAVVTGDDVQHGKPDPEVFLLAAARLGLEPACCVVVEDAPAGIEAARRAGMASIGLASKGRTREELRQASLVVESLAVLGAADFEGLLAS